MKKTVLTFGLIAGGVLSLMMLLTIPFLGTLGFEHGEVIGYTSMVLSFLLVFFGIRSYRESVGKGNLSFIRGFVVGALITTIASVCYTLTWEVIYYKIAPDFGAKYSAYVVDKAKANGAGPAAVQAKVDEMQRFQELYKNPLYNAAITFLEPLPVGLLITLVSAGILRRVPRREARGDATA
jgi:hypothetical protein